MNTRWSWWVAGVLVLGTGSVVQRAHACSCVEAPPRVLVPAPDAKSVPVDTPLVVLGTVGERLFLRVPDPEPLPTSEAPPTDEPAPTGTGASFDGGVIAHPRGVHLVAEDGAIVLVQEVSGRRTPGCSGRYAFLQPEEGELSPNTTFAVFSGETKLTTFTTGSERRDREVEVAAARAVEIATLGNAEGSIATAYVSNVTTSLFIHYAGSTEEVTYALPNSPQGVNAFDVGFVECPVFHLLGIDGEVLDERKVCEPTRCRPVFDSVGQSSCGGNPGVGVDYETFVGLPETCSPSGPEPGTSVSPQPPPPADSVSPQPPRGPSSPETPTSSTTTDVASSGAEGPWSAPGDQPEPVKVGIDGAAGPERSGCTVGVSRPHDSRRGAWLLVFAGLALALATRRSTV